METQEQINAKLEEYINKNNGQVLLAKGAFGDMEDCAGIVEEGPIEPPEGGRYTKFFGCSYLFKGFPLEEILEGRLPLAKAMISMIPRKIIAHSFFWKIVFILRYVFANRKFWNDVHIWFYSIYLNIVKHVPIPLEKYSKPVKVLREAINKSLEDYIEKKFGEKTDISLIFDDYGRGPIITLIKDNDKIKTITCLAEFIYLFIEFDSAYRLRLQDLLGEVNKANAQKSVIKEMKRLFGILIDRENPQSLGGQKYKWIQMKRLVIPFLYVSGFARDFLRSFLLNLDVDSIRLDEADWYFSLRQRCYRFKGMELDERIKEAEQIDKEKGHVRIKVNLAT